LTKAGCPIADANVFNPALQDEYPECKKWRDAAYDRIESDEGLDLVIVSSASYYSVVEGGKKLGDAESRKILEARYAEALERLQATGAKVVVMLDIPHAPFAVSDCVSENVKSLSNCAFPLSEAKNSEPFDAPAAARVPGVEVIEVGKLICPDGLCRAVIGDAIVYRGSNHMTATFAATLSHYVWARLPKL
jgi:hypothetical protein